MAYQDYTVEDAYDIGHEAYRDREERDGWDSGDMAPWLVPLYQLGWDAAERDAKAKGMDWETVDAEQQWEERQLWLRG